jgi:acyl carrier protein phosphodiesterase
LTRVCLSNTAEGKARIHALAESQWAELEAERQHLEEIMQDFEHEVLGKSERSEEERGKIDDGEMEDLQA